MKAYDLRCEAMKDALGIDHAQPRLTWKMCAERRNVRQTAYRLIVSSSEERAARGEGDLFDSGKIDTHKNAHVLSALPLQSAARYYWSVQLWDDLGARSDFADPQWWEMGLTAAGDWANAHWIEPQQRPQLAISQDHVDFHVYPDLPDTSAFVPCQLLRREFTLREKPRRARAYATAHGVYTLHINGMQPGDLALAPEPTPYDSYLQYQTYDITHCLHAGVNAVGIHLAPGWWSGIIGLFSASCQYGERMAALAKLVFEYEDGQVEQIVTDGTFVSSESPVRYAEIFVGEKYDAARAKAGWSLPGFDAADWTGVQCAPSYPKEGVLRGQNAEPIRVCARLKPLSILTTPCGETVIDFGQVLAGKAHVEFSAAPGTVVTFHHTEALDSAGNYALNIFCPYNQSTDTFIVGGDGRGVYEPSFVYHGFRYVMVRGDAAIDQKSVTALVMHSDLPTDGTFSCSDERVTRLNENILRTLLGNFMAIPTDNPDRERAGWTGDAQMIVETACYHLGTQAFWRRWLEQMRLEQRADGQITHIVPAWKSYNSMGHHRDDSTSSAWGDACIIIPWTLYLRYGDKRILRENYDMMSRWLRYVRHIAETKNPEDVGELTPERAKRLTYMWNTGYHYGDWLTPSDCTDDEGNFQYLPRSRPLSTFTPSCYYAQSAQLMSRIAQVLGLDAQAKEYAALSRNVKDACTAELFGEDGLPNEDRQGAQVFSLHFGIAPEGCEEKILAHLLEMIKDNGGRMDTGFSSTQYLLDVLSERGKAYDAYGLLLRNDPPSWLYEVEKGATAIWESWQGIMPDGTVNPVSLMQYANGCVGNWLFGTVAGIRPSAPGFDEIRIAPVTDPRLDFARGQYESVHGAIACAWTRAGERMTVEVRIPANTRARIRLPHAAGKAVFEGGVALERAEGVSILIADGDAVELDAGSGSYRFTY